MDGARSPSPPLDAVVGSVPHESGTDSATLTAEPLQRLDSFSYVPQATSSGVAAVVDTPVAVISPIDAVVAVTAMATWTEAPPEQNDSRATPSAATEASGDAAAPPQRRSGRSSTPLIREYPIAGSQCALFEAFVVVGVGRDAPASDTPQDAEILYCFPSSYDCAANKAKLSNAAKFALAEQVRVRGVARSYSNSALNKLMHGSDHAFARRHVFCFNNPDGTYEWGACLIKDELLSMPASFLGLVAPLLSVHQAATADNTPRAAERVCFVDVLVLCGLNFVRR